MQVAIICQKPGVCMDVPAESIVGGGEHISPSWQQCIYLLLLFFLSVCSLSNCLCSGWFPVRSSRRSLYFRVLSAFCAGAVPETKARPGFVHAHDDRGPGAAVTSRGANFKSLGKLAELGNDRGHSGDFPEHLQSLPQVRAVQMGLNFACFAFWYI